MSASDPLKYWKNFQTHGRAGQLIELPSSYRAVHLHRKEKDGATSWVASSRSQKVRVWEQDVPPAATTGRIRAFEWIKLAPQLHVQVAPADVDKRVHNMCC